MFLKLKLKYSSLILIPGAKILWFRDFLLNTTGEGLLPSHVLYSIDGEPVLVSMLFPSSALNFSMVEDLVLQF